MFFAQRRLLLPLLLLLPFCLLFLAGTLGQCCCCCEGCCCMDLGPCGPCDGSFFPAAFPAGLGLGFYGLYGRKKRQIIGRRTLSERSAAGLHPLPEPRPVADWLAERKNQSLLPEMVGHVEEESGRKQKEEKRGK